MHRPTNTTFLTGRTRVSGGPRGEIVLASTDGGERWSQVGAFRGQMYFLSGREALYMQTADDLLMLPLLPPTAVSAESRAATTWSAIKFTGSASK